MNEESYVKLKEFLKNAPNEDIEMFWKKNEGKYIVGSKGSGENIEENQEDN